MLSLIILVSAAASALCAALLCLILGPGRIGRVSRPLSLVAVGFLLGLSLVHILPEACEEIEPHTAGLLALAAILFLCAVEMCFNFHGRHRHHVALSSGGAGLLSGSFLHTLCDGVVIAGSYLSDVHLGLAVTAAVISHEIAHELGDFALMIECGLKPQQAFVVNAVALTGSLVGAVGGILVLGSFSALLPYILALSGASFIYVALADLLPRMKVAESLSKMGAKMAFMLSGAALSLLLSLFEH